MQVATSQNGKISTGDIILRISHRIMLMCLLGYLVGSASGVLLAELSDQTQFQDGEVIIKTLKNFETGDNLLKPSAWRPYELGFLSENGVFLCENGKSDRDVRGAVQTIELNQTVPAPLLAIAESAADSVGGSRDNDYSLYLDLQYTDGTPLWGQAAAFDVGTHDWQEKQVIIFPEKPVKRVSYYLLFRRHTGRAKFRNPRLFQLAISSGGFFDGVPCTWNKVPRRGLVLRDVKAGSDFVSLRQSALGIECQQVVTPHASGEFIDLTLKHTGTDDRILTLVFLEPLNLSGGQEQTPQWLMGPGQGESIAGDKEYTVSARTQAGVARRFSRWPLAAIKRGDQGQALGIDMAYPAVFRVGFHAGLGSLFLSYDIALTKEQPAAKLRFVTWRFPAAEGFRQALQTYYELFPDAFAVRIKQQGLWMPFAKISSVQDWEDFGFRFKEGDNEVPWDDAHDILTFRYTEPMTWWMPMAPELPRTYEAAVAEAERLAQAGRPQARAWLTSSFRDHQGRVPVRLLDTPWCNGAVWSMNSLPQIPGEVTDFRLKWNPQIRERLYGPAKQADLDGEYIDSSEGYVTDELDFRREHFVGERPLTYDGDTLQPAVFRGLIAFEYVRAIAEDIHGLGKFMMANATPHNLCWLAPLLDVLGTETDWNPGGQWRPMSQSELFYRRALCGAKPYCFLMNTNFDRFSYERVEKYMQRSLAWGMFPGFFSPDASTGHYFSRPELYNRDRPLFKKYVPLCRLVAEAGWQPVPLARSSHPDVFVERFGERYFTVFNDSQQAQTVTVRFAESLVPGSRVKELVRDETLACQQGTVTLTLGSEEVAVLDIFAGQ